VLIIRSSYHIDCGPNITLVLIRSQLKFECRNWLSWGFSFILFRSRCVLEPYLKIGYGHFHVLSRSFVTIIIVNMMCWAVKNVIIQVVQSQQTYQNALLPYDGGQSLHAEKDMVIYCFKTCSSTVVSWSM
jgi:hypothetical protein